MLEYIHILYKNVLNERNLHMIKPKNPCFGCVAPVRFPGCHSICEEGKKFARDRKEYNEYVSASRMDEFASYLLENKKSKYSDV